MNNLTLSLCALCASVLFAANAAAQQMPTPAEELANYDRIIGHFEGSGTVVHQAGGKPQKWTATITASKTLDGFFIQEDMVIEFEGEVPHMGGDARREEVEVTPVTPDSVRNNTVLVFRTFYGYDSERKRYMIWSMSNMGGVSQAEITWPGKDTMLMAGMEMLQGKRQLHRWQTKFSATGYDVVGHQCLDGGEWHVHVKGSYKKVEKITPKVKITDAAAFMVKPHKNMKRLQPWTGKLRFKGNMIMMPGMPAMDIAGVSVGKMICGGTVLELAVLGDEMNGMRFKGYGCMAWHERDECYKGFWLDNMGGAMFDESRWASAGQLVSTCNRMYMGQPTVQQTITNVKGRKMRSVTTYTLMGTHEPMKSFEITYPENAK